MKRSLLLILFFFMLHAVDTFAGQQRDSLSIKIGQMLMIGFRGLDADDEPRLAADIRDRGIGGVVLFDYDVPSKSPVRNIDNQEQVARLTSGLQALAEIPLFIAIDQEGGMVSRLKPARGFPPSPTAAHLGSLDNRDSTLFAALRTGALLKQLHINMNLAPDVDLNSNPDNPVIGKLDRSFSPDPAVVSRQARLMVEGYHENGIIAVLKHFPGHGSSATDTHQGFTDITDTWSPKELDPYRVLLESGYRDAVMTAHVFHRGLDSSYPATLSKAVVTGKLRKKLGFRGVVISDDLQMKAISDHYGLETAISQCLDAGVDILLFANNSVYDPAIAEKSAAIIRSLVDRGIVSKNRIDMSYRRIMDLKIHHLFPCK
jgi:beta-N-acetylhexosaminidase